MAWEDTINKRRFLLHCEVTLGVKVATGLFHSSKKKSAKRNKQKL
jgi:hypothetical protein